MKDDDLEMCDNEIEEDDIYEAEELSEDDGISVEESAFMIGYKEAVKKKKDQETEEEKEED